MEKQGKLERKLLHQHDLPKGREEMNKLTKLNNQPNLKATFVLPKLPKVYDQGTNGDCVANAFAYVIVLKQTTKISRLFLYALCRILDNTPLNVDSGTTIMTACTVLSQYGYCKEDAFPYSKSIQKLPSLQSFQSSQLVPTYSYQNVPQDIATIKNVLYSGKPIIFGINVYQSFMTPRVEKTGMIPMPDLKTEVCLGGHCICMVGYNDSNSTFMCANSWGDTWGFNGFFFLPYKYVSDKRLALDFTVINI